MLKVNRNLSEAMTLFNRMSLPRGEIILSRIFAKPGASYKELFMQEELAKFNKAMQINEQQLANIV
jgi:hypothetical protein